MRRTKRSEHFLVCLLFNMLLNWEGIIPAVVVHPAPLSWLVRLVGCAGAGGMDRQSDRVDACDRMGNQMQQHT